LATDSLILDDTDSLLYLMLAEPDQVNDMTMAVLKKTISSGCTPLIITVNQPYKVMQKTYARQGIVPESYYVVDAVTQYSGGAPVPGPRVKYVTNPSNLTDLGIAIAEFLKQIPEQKKCIIFDSVSMLLIHIPTATASKFLHFVVNKLKLSDISGIFLCVEKGLDPLVLSQMSAFVDHVVEYEPAGREKSPET
jgi:hypothetical protein